MDELEEMKKKVKTLEGDKAAAEQLADENAAKAKSFDAVKAAAGELVDNPEQLKAAVVAGVEYRKSLVDQIVTAKRLLGMVGDTEEEATSAKALYANASIEMLKAEADAFAKKSPSGGNLEGGDPNSTGAEGDEGGKGLRDSSVTKQAVGLEQK